MERIRRNPEKRWNRKRTGFSADNPMGDMLLVYMESKDIQKTFMSFASSKDPLDLWFMRNEEKHWRRLHSAPVWSAA
jgi:hypothetical protein